MSSMPAMSAPASPAAAFDLGNDDAYQAWRSRKLADYPASAEALAVDIGDPYALSAAEHQALAERIRKTNLALYRFRTPETAGKEAIRSLGAQFGLVRLDDNLCADEDSITSLQVNDSGRHADYIPYTNKPLSWHTDGYYNAPDRCIRAFVIHCASPAAAGGDNALLDPEIAYIALRDANPGYIRAFMAEDVMTIPANVEGGVELRPAQSGPVFSVDAKNGALHMRYTARKRNIIWKEDALTLEAVAFLEQLLRQSPYIFSHRLQAGQGIICNNVLHNRSGFHDDEAAGQRRLMYRARYYDRIDAGPAVPG